MKASAVVADIEKQLAFLKTLGDHEISGFVMIVPPEGQVLAYPFMDVTANSETFYSYLANRVKAIMELTSFDGVRVPGMPRR